ncbi:MAG: hypothetical protein IT561_19880, partial [Alphaproteobacteria bacterium]|nr:hypothetical protein [Alphaproteobacteria bacterium]
KAQIERAVAAAAARQEADAAARERIERAEARAERLEADVGAVEGAVSAALRQALEAVGQRLDGIEKELAAVGRRTDAAAAAGAASQQMLERQAERAAGLEKELAAVRQRAADADAAVRQVVEGLAERVARLERDGAERAGLVAGATQELADRAGKLEKDVGSLAQQHAATAGVAGALGDRLRQLGAGFDERTGRLERDVASLAQQQMATAGAAGALGERLRQVGEGFSDRTVRLEKEVAALTQQHTATAAEIQLERLLAAAIHLAATVQEPRPFGRELAYVRQLAEGIPGLAPPIGELQAYAARGAPTVADLRVAFRTLAPAIIASAPEGGDGWFGTAARWATDAAARFGVVEPRPPSPTRVAVGAVDAHLMRGQLPQAVAALVPVDGLGVGPAATWLLLARSRLAVDQASTELVNRAMALSLTR